MTGKDIVTSGLKLFLITLVSGVILAFVYASTKKRIALNEKAKIENSMKVIMPEMKRYINKTNYYEIYGEKNLIGYIFNVKGSGYGGDIVCNIGIYTNGKVAGIFVLSHQETPGLGTKAVKSKKFLSQFQGQIEEEINKTFKPVTGATISSRGILKAVMEAFKKYKKYIKK